MEQNEEIEIKEVKFSNKGRNKDNNKVKYGGKGSNLEFLKTHKFNIPKFFVIEINVYEQFLKENDLFDFIKEKLKLLFTENENSNQVEIVCKEIKKQIISKPFSEEIKTKIFELIDSNKLEKVSVRSSCVNEDSKEHSFAGQFDTYLNIEGKDNILSSIKKCFASIFNVRSIQYFINNGFLIKKENYEDEDLPKMAVVIQEMIFADLSGILFTADTFNSSRNYLMIEIGYGLGEGLVSGEIQGDFFIVRKDTLEIKERIIREKKDSLVKNEDGGLKKSTIQTEESKAQCIDDKLLLDLVKIGKKIEEAYSFEPQDIEFSIKDNEIFILQSRSITTLHPEIISANIPLEEDKDFDEEEYVIKRRLQYRKNNPIRTVYFNFAYDQNMLEPWSSFGAELFEILVSSGLPAPINEKGDHVLFAAKRIFMDFLTILPLFKVSDFGQKNLHEISNYILNNEKDININAGNICTVIKKICDMASDLEKENKENAKNKKYDLTFENEFKRSLCAYFCCCGFITSSCCKSSKEVEEIETEVTNSLMKIIDQIKFKKLDVNDTEEQIHKDIRENIEKYHVTMKNATGKIMKFDLNHIYHFLLNEVYLKMCLFGKPYKNFDAKVLGGLEGNITTKGLHMVGELTDICRDDEEMIEILDKILEIKENLTYENFKKEYENEILRTNSGESFLRYFDSYMSLFGMRGPAEVDIGKLRYEDRIQLILINVKAMLEQEKGIHIKRFEQAKENSLKEIDRMMKERKKQCILCSLFTCGICTCCGIMDLICIKKTFSDYRKFYAFREHPKYNLIRMYGEYRKVIKDIGKYFKKIGYIANESDVFYLRSSDMLDIINKNIRKQYVKDIISFRMKEYESSKKIKVPPIMIDNYTEDFSKSLERWKGKQEKGVHEDERSIENPDLIFGEGCSAGIVTGIAKVIFSYDDIHELKSGDILITNNTDPGWTPCFNVCGGILIVMGGTSQHGVLVAREMGIPCISGLNEIDKKIKSGYKLKINGTSGRIDILDRFGK